MLVGSPRFHLTGVLVFPDSTIHVSTCLYVFSRARRKSATAQSFLIAGPLFWCKAAPIVTMPASFGGEIQTSYMAPLSSTMCVALNLFVLVLREQVQAMCVSPFIKNRLYGFVVAHFPVLPTPGITSCHEAQRNGNLVHVLARDANHFIVSAIFISSRRSWFTTEDRSRPFLEAILSTKSETSSSR